MRTRRERSLSRSLRIEEGTQEGSGTGKECEVKIDDRKRVSLDFDRDR